jgi:hypothetical protein
MREKHTESPPLPQINWIPMVLRLRMRGSIQAWLSGRSNTWEQDKEPALIPDEHSPAAISFEESHDVWDIMGNGFIIFSKEFAW